MADTINLAVASDTIAPPSETPQESQRVTARTAAAAAFLALSMSVGGQQAQSAPTTPMMSDDHTIVLAQASTQETDGKIYTAEVIQVDGSKKMVTYYRNKRGAVIAPPVVDGKLVDGSVAPSNPIEARVAQKDILINYDKLILAKVEKDGLLNNADKNLKEIVKITKEGTILTKEQLSNGFFSVYIIKYGLDHSGVNSLISGLETIARVKMKMDQAEIARTKQEAEVRANKIWKSVTGAIDVK